MRCASCVRPCLAAILLWEAVSRIETHSVVLVKWESLRSPEAALILVVTTRPDVEGKIQQESQGIGVVLKRPVYS